MIEYTWVEFGQKAFAPEMAPAAFGKLVEIGADAVAEQPDVLLVTVTV